MTWYCLSCRRTVGILINKVNELDIRCKKNSANIIKVNAKCEANSKVADANSKLITELKLEIDHVRNLEPKKSNLILRGLPEDSSPASNEESSVESIAKNDFIAVKALCDDTIKLEPRDFVSIKRLGKVSDVEGKFRPVQLRFKNQDTRTKILKECKNLQIEIGQKHYPVYFSSERTKLQEQILFNLREERREREKKGERDWTIFRYRLEKKNTIQTTKKTFESLF